MKAVMSKEPRACGVQKAFSCAILILLTLAGCKPSEEPAKPEKIDPIIMPKEPIPAIIINLATINLSKLNTLYHKNDLIKLGEIIKLEDIQILTVQSVTRYPELPKRLDIIEEIKNLTDMNAKFGETENNSGRQSGNAVFSIYPIKNPDNMEYKSYNNLSTALGVTIDAGIGNIFVVSTSVPLHLTTESLSELISFREKHLCSTGIITGNFGESLSNNFKNSGTINYDKTKIEFVTTSLIKRKGYYRYLFYFRDDSIKILDKKIVDTPIGLVFVYKFGLFNDINSQK
jgi:hypothetical protein